MGCFKDPGCNYFMLKRIQMLIVCLLMTATVHGGEKLASPDHVPGAVTVTAEELIKLVFSNPDIVLIDSRKKSEFLKGHIEGAVNILNTQMHQKDLEAIAADKNIAILFYCNGERCLRSYDAVSKALDWGYSNIFWFRGGWKEWTEKRFPVVVGE